MTPAVTASWSIQKLFRIQTLLEETRSIHITCNVILAALEQYAISLISSTTISLDASFHSSAQRPHLMMLGLAHATCSSREKLSLVTRGTMRVSEFLHTKVIVDELTFLVARPLNADMLVCCTRDLGSASKEIIATLPTPDLKISFGDICKIN